MTLPPSRAEILAALQDPKPNALAERVAVALDKCASAFARDAEQRGGFERITLPAPADEVESVALELFMQQLRAQLPPDAKITIRGDS